MRDLPSKLQGQLSIRRAERARLIETGLVQQGISDPAVLAAINQVPREFFVDPEFKDKAYHNRALPIASGQTISQPYIVALMAEALQLTPHFRLLEIGTGSGYAAAVYAQLVDQVFTIERHDFLVNLSRSRLEELQIENVSVRCGDGSFGWPEAAPFDAISIAAATEDIPKQLLNQLTIGGKLVAPIGDQQSNQSLICFKRTEGGFEKKDLGSVRFVPLISDADEDLPSD
ncbi:Protein-L-isoaspartate O-methyltransferase [Thalassoglobus neptunius]|uniref:Protein-L-isoaspartate O-methyltransferase n=1 Tax=Thalassoglobus neptunius TaxID=1938619 RepID=A0A5C5WA85_9PLAN|nr:protein-L-isoaspartate(D-aspartate) O-methyltransferase [Thalassoglobus neptunius]TWT46969.1 Protein-L-isoaspartate O-methyltransferase [Thalassoglobus neptunius]